MLEHILLAFLYFCGVGIISCSYSHYLLLYPRRKWDGPCTRTNLPTPFLAWHRWNMSMHISSTRFKSDMLRQDKEIGRSGVIQMQHVISLSRRWTLFQKHTSMEAIIAKVDFLMHRFTRHEDCMKLHQQATTSLNTELIFSSDLWISMRCNSKIYLRGMGLRIVSNER